VRQFADPFARSGNGAASSYQPGEAAQGGKESGQPHAQPGAQPGAQAGAQAAGSQRGERGATTH
jgi:hypothetical protein